MVCLEIHRTQLSSEWPALLPIFRQWRTEHVKSAETSISHASTVKLNLNIPADRRRIEISAPRHRALANIDFRPPLLVLALDREPYHSRSAGLNTPFPR